MEQINLSRIVEKLESGNREKGGSIDSGVISVGGTQISNEGGFKWKKKEYISEEFYKKMRSGKISKNDILIVKDGATTGKVSFVDESFPYVHAAINEHVFRVQINQEFAHPKYVFYYLNSPKGQEQILSDYRGATVGGISRGFIDKVEIPLPNLETQNNVVAVLDKISSLIEKRKDTISLYDQLIASTFHQMFGDPMDNPKKWKTDRIGNNLLAIRAGKSYGGEDKPILDDDELGVLKISSVTKGIFNAKEFKAVKKSIVAEDLVFPSKGDLLFSRANTMELVGATCIVNEDYENLFLPDKLWKITPDERSLKKTYLHFVLQSKSIRSSFINIATGSSGSMLNISMEKLRNIEIPVASIELQNKFDTLYKKSRSHIEKLLVSKSKIETLKKSLSQQAFSGRSQYDIDLEIEAILNSFDLQDKTWINKRSAVAAFNSIIKDQTFLKRLLDKSEEQEFNDILLYDKAKNIIFRALKKKKNLIEQIFEEVDGTPRVKLVLV